MEPNEPDNNAKVNFLINEFIEDIFIKEIIHRMNEVKISSNQLNVF